MRNLSLITAAALICAGIAAGCSPRDSTGNVGAPGAGSTTGGTAPAPMPPASAASR